MTTVNVRYMVDDVDAAVTFYTTHLGFTLMSRTPPAFADVALGDLRLLLSGPTSSCRATDAGRPPARSRRLDRIHLIVDDLAAEVARLRQAGGIRFRSDIVTGPGGAQYVWTIRRQSDRAVPASTRAMTISTLFRAARFAVLGHPARRSPGRLLPLELRRGASSRGATQPDHHARAPSGEERRQQLFPRARVDVGVQVEPALETRDALGEHPAPRDEGGAVGRGRIVREGEDIGRPPPLLDAEERTFETGEGLRGIQAPQRERPRLARDPGKDQACDLALGARLYAEQPRRAEPASGGGRRSAGRRGARHGQGLLQGQALIVAGGGQALGEREGTDRASPGAGPPTSGRPARTVPRRGGTRTRSFETYSTEPALQRVDEQRRLPRALRVRRRSRRGSPTAKAEAWRSTSPSRWA